MRGTSLRTAVVRDEGPLSARVCSLEREGFCPWLVTSVPTGDFWDDERVRTVYYPELEELTEED